MNDSHSTRLDLALAGRMVDAALEAAEVGASERARLGCAKTLLRLEPPATAAIRPGNFAQALRDISLG
jgi:hypothetical protein